MCALESPIIQLVAIWICYGSIIKYKYDDQTTQQQRMNETEYFVIQKTFGDPAGDVLSFTVESYKTCIIKIGMDVHIDRSDFIRLLFDGRFVHIAEKHI